MSTPSFDPMHYYPSYIHPHPTLTMEQFRLIQQSWKLAKDGQFDAFKAQKLIDDPLGFWGLQLVRHALCTQPRLETHVYQHVYAEPNADRDGGGCLRTVTRDA